MCSIIQDRKRSQICPCWIKVKSTNRQCYKSVAQLVTTNASIIYIYNYIYRFGLGTVGKYTHTRCLSPRPAAAHYKVNTVQLLTSLAHSETSTHAHKYWMLQVEVYKVKKNEAAGFKFWQSILISVGLLRKLWRWTCDLQTPVMVWLWPGRYDLQYSHYYILMVSSSCCVAQLTWASSNCVPNHTVVMTNWSWGSVIHICHTCSSASKLGVT